MVSFRQASLLQCIPSDCNLPCVPSNSLQLFIVFAPMPVCTYLCHGPSQLNSNAEIMTTAISQDLMTLGALPTASYRAIFHVEHCRVYILDNSGNVLSASKIYKLKSTSGSALSVSGLVAAWFSSAWWQGEALHIGH